MLKENKKCDNRSYRTENANSDCCYTKPYKWDMASHTIGGICIFTKFKISM